jgi:hypothetical protein
MGPSSKAIFDSIENLRSTPAVFQRLAEEYARRSFPERFGKLTPSGINPEGVTIPGWPDGYAYDSDGRIHLIEATVSRDWRRHLASDLEKIRESRSRLGSFLFVGWEPNPSPTEEDSYRQKLAGLGVERVDLIFSRKLCRELTAPRFAELRHSLLGLPSSPFPLQRIRAATELYGRTGFMESFAPTIEEYDQHLVHSPRLKQAIELSLCNERWAWVRGFGATGKSVLGAMIGIDWEAGGGICYYLDLARTQDVGVPSVHIIDVITSLLDRDLLFVIDNVHLNWSLAEAIRNQVGSSDVGSALLMLGRHRVRDGRHRGVGGPLEDLSQYAFELRNTAAELLGVYNRLVHRRSDNVVYQQPPPQVLREWERLFAADLIAFSAAVIRKMDDFKAGKWRLTASDARHYVQAEYLRGDLEFRDTLMRLSAMTSLELGTPSLAVSPRGLRGVNERGLVIIQVSASKEEYYRLIHPGLADLILSTANSRGGRKHELLTVVKSAPRSFGPVIQRLRVQGAEEEAAAIVNDNLPSDSALVSFLVEGGESVADTAWRMRLVMKSRSAADVENALSLDLDQFIDAVVRTPIHYVAALFDYLQEHHANYHALMLRCLLEERHEGRLLERVFLTPFHLVYSWLLHLRRYSRELYSRTLAALVSDVNKERLEEMVLRSSLGALVSTAESMGKVHDLRLLGDQVWNSMISRRADVIERAGNSRLLDLASFCAYLAERDYEGPLLREFTNYLQTERGWATVASKIPSTNLGELRSFLGLAEYLLPELHNKTVGYLWGSGNGETFARMAVKASLDDLGSLLGYFRSLSLRRTEWLRCVDEARWGGTLRDRSMFRHDAVGFFNLAKELTRMGRRDLLGVVANAIITGANPRAVQVDNFYIVHLASIIYASTCDHHSINFFARRFADPRWLTIQYRDARHGGLARALFRIVMRDSELLDAFRHESLASRLRVEASRVEDVHHSELAGIVQLFGVAGLFFSDQRIAACWPGHDRLMVALHSLVDADDGRLSITKSMFWLGIRRVVRSQGRGWKIPSSDGCGLLLAWRQAEPETENAVRFNRWMIDWLERCAACGWELAVDERDFIER